MGADRVLVGHSERRSVFGEPDEWMGRKLRAAMDHGVLPILCIGETLDERKANRTDRVLKRQLESGLTLLKPEEFSSLCIAYEPVWAIGTGEVASLEQVSAAHAAIRKFLHTKASEEAISSVRILYGGSVNLDNVTALMSLPEVDGVLVGGASLQPDSFIPIIEYDS